MREQAHQEASSLSTSDAHLGRDSQPSMRSVRWAFSRSVRAWKTLLYSLDSRVISSVGSCSSWAAWAGLAQL